jgi:CBS domain-containing protein
MLEELKEVLAKAHSAGEEFGADVLLAGILPTLRVSDLTLANLTPMPRYQVLNRSLTQLRGAPFSIHIKGLDELQLTHANLMMESCNTSFQVHFQVNPSEFAVTYNIAQAITAPVLAGAVNSPLLFGHRLWQETRLALFQHSADARSRTQLVRSHPTRVGFGEQWLKHSVIELLHDQIGRFRPIMITRPDEDPMQVLVDLAASVMDWRHIRHVPVEDEEGRLVGLITHRALLRLVSRGTQMQNTHPLTVREIMKTDPVTVLSTTPTLKALELMRRNKVGCLPVVDDGRLVGIVTSYDFLEASASLFKEQLTASTAPANGLANAQHT